MNPAVQLPQDSDSPLLRQILNSSRHVAFPSALHTVTSEEVEHNDFKVESKIVAKMQITVEQKERVAKNG
jgi:hypothetical protein